MLGELKTAALIVNPFASAVSEDGLAAVERELRRSLELSVSVTEHGGHATELARELDGVEAVFVYGGDGLLNEVLNGVGPTPAVGVVPGGGKNVVARSLGIPLEPVAAVRALVRAPIRRISLGRANERRFAFAAGIGFDAELVRRVDARGRSSDGRRPGDLVFSWEAVKLLSARRGRYEPALEIAGLGRAAFALVANAHPYTYAGKRPLRIAPAARFELGLDVVAPKRVAPRSLPRLVRYAFFGGGETAADVLYAHDVDRVEVRCDQPLPLQADGEDLGDVEAVVFEAERDAVSMLAPEGGTLTA